MKKTIITLGALLTLASCGGTKTVYVVNTDAPDTTVKLNTTTDAPIAIAPAPAPMPTYSAEDEFIFDIESSYGTIYMDEQELITVGRTTCSTLRGGATADDIYLAINSVTGDQEFVIVVVSSAIVNFCPDQSYKFGV